MRSEFEQEGRRIVIRPVQVDDAQAMIDVVSTIAQEGIYFVVEPQDVRSLHAQRERLAKIHADEECFLAAEVDGVFAGHIQATRGNFAKVRHTASVGICLAPAFRSLGIGARLMEQLEVWARRAGVRKLYLGVFATNARARRLYERMGYEVEGVQRRQFLIDGQFVDDILMGKWLD